MLIRTPTARARLIKKTIAVVLQCEIFSQFVIERKLHRPKGRRISKSAALTLSRSSVIKISSRPFVFI
jgi:hypothetical protein